MNQTTPSLRNPMAAPAGEPPEPILLQVLTHKGETWRIASPPPQGEPEACRGLRQALRTVLGLVRPAATAEEQQILQAAHTLAAEPASDPGLANTQILKMVSFQDGTVKVYVYPKPGSDLDRAQSGLEFTLYPLTIDKAMTIARFDVLKELQEIAEDQALREQEDPDPDPDPEGDDPEATDAPGAPANGAEASGAGASNGAPS